MPKNTRFVRIFMKGILFKDKYSNYMVYVSYV